MAGKFSLFRFARPGKGVKKEDVLPEAPTGFFDFFKVYFSRFWNLSSLNLIFCLANFPIFFGLFAMTGNLNIPIKSPSGSLFAPLYGMMQHNNNPIYNVLYGMLGIEVELLAPTFWTKLFFALAFLLLFTFGFANAGFTSILRGYARRDPVFILSDFWDAIKRNKKQSFIIGLLDIVILVVLSWDLIFWRMQTGFINEILFFASLFMALIYFFMRFYIYLITITFDLSIGKIFKNAFIFAFLGFKRNIVALIGIILTLILNYYIYLLIPLIGVLLPFLIVISTASFISAYAAYPIIKKYMIDPYKSEEPQKFDEDESIFVDRG